MKAQKDNIIRIKNILWINSLDVAKLARKIGKSRTWTSLVLYGRQKSKKTRHDIADALGIRVEELWPEKEAA